MKTLFKIEMLALVLLFTASASAEEYTGYWWRQQSLQFKEGFVTGVANGFPLWANADTINTGKLLRRMNSQQMAKGLDKFYQDPRNRQIFVGTAVVPVVLAINGASKDKIQVMVESLRRNESLPWDWR